MSRGRGHPTVKSWPPHQTSGVSWSESDPSKLSCFRTKQMSLDSSASILSINKPLSAAEVGAESRGIRASQGPCPLWTEHQFLSPLWHVSREVRLSVWLLKMLFPEHTCRCDSVVPRGSLRTGFCTTRAFLRGRLTTQVLQQTVLTCWVIVSTAWLSHLEAGPSRLISRPVMDGGVTIKAHLLCSEAGQLWRVTFAPDDFEVWWGSQDFTVRWPLLCSVLIPSLPFHDGWY